ncbi:hypothetical protein DDR33_07480 [Pararcticibacter amylolyticus]|uniref:Uncharacterized protein n=1 Tax=Pararcticibacter amylolyticus TaxID=2173175 RepID=A0A2U2PIJ1_9SPHI|nr:hypothetical protein DDR33_07480 [Pararcticibacter amylolyticus]
MKDCRFDLFSLILFISLCLVLGSMTAKEEIEKVYADDYDTYVLPHFSSGQGSCLVFLPFSGGAVWHAERPQSSFHYDNHQYRNFISPVLKTPAFILHCTYLI